MFAKAAGASFKVHNRFNRSPSSRASRILSAYADDRPFSISLVGAVVRQGSFIDKMYNFGWLHPGCFDSKLDEIVLLHCIARYHAYASALIQGMVYLICF